LDRPADFTGLVALITGGGTGIGLETARALLADGARVVLTGRRPATLESAARELDPSGRRLAFHAGDIALAATSRTAAGLAVERFGGLDILVNNAGTFLSKGFLAHTENDLDEHLAVGIKGPFFAAQAAIPLLRQRGGGAIVNVGSIIGRSTLPALQTSALSAAKAGLHMLTRNLAQEFAADRIRVNAVAPAMVATPLYDGLMTPAQFAAALPALNAQYPLGRVGQAADIASAILFLASPRNSWISGTVLEIDGGLAAGPHAPRPV
jgi:NAD(P)-dependent dehydrogenase (short-subunit alcohol dehydrogenase family)